MTMHLKRCNMCAVFWGVQMKQLLCLTLLLLALVPASAFADSISIYLQPNCCGDNFEYVKRTGRDAST